MSEDSNRINNSYAVKNLREDYEKEKTISVVNGRNAELSRLGKELNPSLMDLENATAGFLIDIGALLRTPKFANEDLEPVIETLHQTEMLLIEINNLRKVCR